VRSASLVSGRWRPTQGARGTTPNHRPTNERQRRCRRYGRATNTPAEGRHRPARPGCLRYGTAYCASTRSTGKNAYGSLAVTSRPALGEALLGLQQPMHHQQLAHQVIQGLAGGSPVRIAQRPGKEHMSLLLLLGVIRPGSAILALCTDSSGAAAGSWPMTSTTSMGPKAARSRRRAASWSSSTSGTEPQCTIMVMYRAVELAGRHPTWHLHLDRFGRCRTDGIGPAAQAGVAGRRPTATTQGCQPTLAPLIRG
jgi:hypothetical protein